MSRYVTVELTASSEKGTGSWVDVSHMDKILVAISNSTAASVVSATLILHGTNDILGSAAGAGREPFFRLGSAAVATTADMSQIAVSTLNGAEVATPVYPKYMRLRLSTFTQGSPKLVLTGISRFVGET